MFEFFIFISLIYVVIGVSYLYRVIIRWHTLWDDDVRPEELRFAASAAFYLLVPPAVALHELGHAALVWANGLEVLDWMFLGYMGWVVHASAGALPDFAIALAGNVVTLLIGVGALALGIMRPGHPVRNVLLIELGRQSLFLVLVFYPALCLAFDGDFVRIYDFDTTPIASGIVAAVHASLLAVGYGVVWKKYWQPRVRLLTSPMALRTLELERRVVADPQDFAANRDLGLLCASAGEWARARRHLGVAIEHGFADARVFLAHGTSLLETGDPARAIVDLERALGGLLRAEDRFVAEVPLVRALAEVGRKDEARQRAEQLLVANPNSSMVRELCDRLRS